MVSSTTETNQLSVLDFQIRIGVEILTIGKCTSGYMFQLGGNSDQLEKQEANVCSIVNSRGRVLGTGKYSTRSNVVMSTYHRYQE